MRISPILTIRPLTCFLLFLILTQAAPAGFGQGKPMVPDAIGAFRKSLRKTAETTRTITCDFTQEKVMSMIAERIVSSGKFYLKKEKMLRWEYTHPYSYLIVIRNDEITIKDENKVNQFNMRTNKVFSEVNRILLGSLQGTLLDDEKSFSATFYEHQDARLVKLKTLNPKLKETLAGINLWFDRSDNTVSRLEMLEAGGDKTTITFSNRKINTEVPDEKFLVR